MTDHTTLPMPALPPSSLSAQPHALSPVPVRSPFRSVYLSGPISGLRYEEGKQWREYAAARLAPEILAYSPLRGHEHLAEEGILRGAYEDHPLTTARALTARDCFDCYACDLTLCNLLGATEVSIGTCIELGWTNTFSHPLVLVMEPRGNVHDHPLVRGSASIEASTLEEALRLVRAILLP